MSSNRRSSPDQNTSSLTHSEPLPEAHEASQQPRWPWTTRTGRDLIFANGVGVFTREALASRGTCCDSGCRNCPYRARTQLESPQAKLRVHSLVPSWTETLLMAGAELVGRTRYCIHPRDLVVEIPIHGGTKTLLAPDAASMVVMSGDLVILDRDENPREFRERFDALGARVIATHIRSAEDLRGCLGELAQVFAAHQDRDVAERLTEMQHRVERVMTLAPTGRLPILQSLGGPWDPRRPAALVIWRDEQRPTRSVPGLEAEVDWMIASPQVFLGDVFRRLTGTSLWIPELGSDPPEASIYPRTSQFPQGLQILLITEPFPFWRKFDVWGRDLLSQGARGVHLVDGEAISWFGVRSLRLLEDLLAE